MSDSSCHTFRLRAMISGTSATTLGVTGTANRAQLAKILVNYADKLGGQ